MSGEDAHVEDQDSDASLSGFALCLSGFGDASSLPTERSWRDSELSDWQIRLGDGRTYDAHRVILGEGLYRSEFFLGQFRSWPNQTSTDLTIVLPALCWPVFEQVLDFMYTGVVEPQPSTAVPLFKTAQVLLIRALAQRVVAWLECNLTKETSPIVLDHALQLSPGLEGLVSEVVRQVAEDFERYTAAEFVKFPASTAAQVLAHRSLRGPMSKVSRMASAVIRHARGEEEQARVFEHLVGFVREVAPEDAIFLLGVCNRFGNDGLRKQCLAVVAAHFHELAGELHAITDQETLIELFDRDDLLAESEDRVFDAVLSTMRSRSPEFSAEQVRRLWSTCRFAQLSVEKLCHEALLVEGLPQDIVRYGLAARLVRMEGGDAGTAKFAAAHGLSSEDQGRLHRRGTVVVHCAMVSPFDTNGVLYHIATGGGSMPWTNPSASGQVAVTMSFVSNGSRHHCVLRPDVEGCEVMNDTLNKPNQWIRLDLGERRSLCVAHYCLRADSQGEFAVRSWELQGSNCPDGPWVTLRRHDDDETLPARKFAIAAWSVERTPQHFRFFRIHQHGKNAQGSDYLKIAGLELYGKFIDHRGRGGDLGAATSL